MTNPEQRRSRTGGAGDLHRQTLGDSVIRVLSYVWILAVLEVLPLRSGVPTDGLVGQWELDGNGMDSSGNDYHGTLTGTVPTADRFGNPGAALSFDGVDDHVWLADHAVDLQPEFVSIAAWFKAAANSTGCLSVLRSRTSGYSLAVVPTGELFRVSLAPTTLGLGTSGGASSRICVRL